MHKNNWKNCAERDANFEKKLHLTKDQRFPRCFKEASRVLRDAKSKKRNIKTLLYSTKFKGKAFRRVYALAYKVLENIKLIDKIIEDVGLLTKEPKFNEECAEILVHEICFVKRPLSGKSKPVLIIQKYQKCIEESFSKYTSAGGENWATDNYATDIFRLPRYARVNTLLTSVDIVIPKLKELEFKQIEYKDDASLKKYHKMVKLLKDKEFVVDFHFKDLLVFSSQQSLSDLNLYHEGHIFLHDKSSYIPVHLLNPPTGSIVLDCCAAPGMKTVHLAAHMNNCGKIFAIDRDEARFENLKSSLKHGGVKICKTSCCDFLNAEPKSEPFSTVEYILLDPSCSGSGMVSRMDHLFDNQDSKSDDRLKKLAGFQILLLKHALSFPSVKRIVYSTCSIHEQENEYVIHEALQSYSDKFCIVPALPEWPAHGVGDYEYAHLCLRASPQISLTNGFFVAVFDRISSQQQPIKSDSSVAKQKNSRDMKMHSMDVMQFEVNNNKNSEGIQEELVDLTLNTTKKKRKLKAQSSNKFQEHYSSEPRGKTRSNDIISATEINGNADVRKCDFVNQENIHHYGENERFFTPKKCKKRKHKDSADELPKKKKSPLKLRKFKLK